MSLLDDVSIVVTPNGYKAGTLYGVLPTATESSELVTSWTNSDFASFTSSGSNITQMVSSANGNNCYSNAVTITSGKIYKLKFTSSQAISCQIRIAPNTILTSATVVLTSLSLGSNEIEFIAPSNYAYIGFRATSSFTDTQISDFTLKEQTKSDMVVTRATAATRVDENGLVNYAEILGSELVTNGNFDSNITGWSAKDCTIVWDNGKLKADNSSGNANGGAFQNIGLVTGKTYQMTATMQLLTGSSNGTFNLFTSAAGGTGQTSVYTGSALVVGGAAVTETFYFTPGSGDVSIQFTCDESNATYTIDNVSVKEVTRNNVPRIDYTGGGCPHILAEPQRTNLLTYSEDFSQWDLVRSTSTSNALISPSGETNADKLQSNTTGASGSWYREVISSFSGSHIFSVFAKSGTTDFMQLRIDGIGGVVYDLSDGTVKSQTSAIGSVEDYGNGWYRCSAQATASSSTAVMILVGNVNMTTVNWFVTSGDNIYVWGAQLEAGSYPTSYIPTSGSTVTRNQDVFTRDGIASLINSTEGVLFVEMAALSDDSTFRGISISDGTISNRCVLRYGGASNRLNVLVVSGGSSVFDSNSILSNIKNFNKIAVKWKANDFAFWVNGVEVATDTSGNAPIGLSQLQFANSTNSSSFLFGKVKQLQVYKTALTDAQLTSLTT